MIRGEKNLFLYFYLRNKVKGIETIITNRNSREQEEKEGNLVYFFKKTGAAALVTIGVYVIFFYIRQGDLLGPAKIVANPLILLEIFLAFLYLLAIFLVFPVISSLINRKKIPGQGGFQKWGKEVLSVLIVNVVFLTLINYAPLFIIFPELDPDPEVFKIGYTVSSIFALFFYFFVERARSRKKLQEEMLRSARLQKVNFQAQLETLKQQVNPHFLFNSLNVLRSLILQNQEKATEFTHRLSELYRSFLKYGDKHLISVQEELEVAEAYIYLLETRFGNALEFEVDIKAEAMQMKLPPGALQMLIENAIKHNGSTRKNPLKIFISSTKDRLMVRNNLQPRTEKLESTGTGLKNIESRYRYLSDKNISVDKTEKEFVASLPLLNNESDEHSNN